MNETLKLTKLEKSWILYDIANSAFILLVATLMPIYFNALAGAAGLSESDYLAYWAYAGSVVTVIVAIIAPICGTLADQKGFKKPLFLICLSMGALGCAALGGAWSWLSFLVIFVIAKVGFSSSIVFYDSMLPEITTEERMDKILDNLEARFTYPVFVKPANLGSSIGVSRADDREGLIDSLELAFDYDRRVLVEKGLDKPIELNCSVLGYDDDVTASPIEMPISGEEFLIRAAAAVKRLREMVDGE